MYIDINIKNKKDCERTSLFLMTNLGAEFSRIFTYKEKGDILNVDMASIRANKIISEILLLEDMQPRKDEILKIIDVINSTSNKNDLVVSKKDVENYFNPFALRFVNQSQIV